MCMEELVMAYSSADPLPPVWPPNHQRNQRGSACFIRSQQKVMVVSVSSNLLPCDPLFPPMPLSASQPDSRPFWGVNHSKRLPPALRQSSHFQIQFPKTRPIIAIIRVNKGTDLCPTRSHRSPVRFLLSANPSPMIASWTAFTADFVPPPARLMWKRVMKMRGLAAVSI